MSMEKWGLIKHTILDRVREVEHAVESGLYQSALALALTLPDICGEVESPKSGDGERYRTWFDNHVSPKYMTKTIPAEDPDKRILTGSVCYKLRCAYLHSGNDDIKNAGKSSIVGGVDEDYETTCRFVLTTDVVDTLECNTDDSNMTREYVVRINVPKMCTKICEAVKEFVESVGDISAFDQNSISLYSSKKWQQDQAAFFEKGE